MNHILQLGILQFLIALSSADVTVSTSKNLDKCQQLNSSSKDINCRLFDNSIDSILNIGHGLNTFGRFTLDDATIANHFTNNIVVIGEIHRSNDLEQNKLETVVLLHKNNTNGLKEFKTICYPVSETDQISRQVIAQIEDELLKDSHMCNLTTESNTLVEKRIKALASYSACKAGPWMNDPHWDKRLKQVYSKKLCGLCTERNTDDICSFSNICAHSHSAIDCLLNGGDIAITTVQETHLKLDKLIDYVYLCPNGSQSTNINSTCTWNKPPNDVLIANKNDIELISKLKTIYENKSSDSLSDKIEKKLSPIIYNSSNEHLVLLVRSKNITEYSKEVRQTNKCDDPPIRWCVTSQQELDKCNWLTQAAHINGIYPGISCIMGNSCIQDISNDISDIATIDADDAFASKKSQNLKPIAFPHLNTTRKALLLIKDTNITLKDLKGKKGCFSKYGNIAYISMLVTLQNHNIVSNNSNEYDKIASAFFGPSCTPGIRDPLELASEDLDQDKLCALCAGSQSSKTETNCNAGAENKYYGNEGALQCLQDVGDFAVIDTEGINASKFNNVQVLCKNNTIAAQVGIDVDDECYLSISVQSLMIVRANNTYIENIKIKELLHEIDNQFGHSSNETFKIFDAFNKNDNLLFKNSTVGLDFNISDTSIYNHLYLFKNCILSISSASKLVIAYPFMLLVVVLVNLI